MSATLDVGSALAQRVLAAQGRIESGEIANMRTYRLPSEPKIHTRLLGEGTTLCGVPLTGHEGQWAWQFIHRGSFGSRMPSGSDGPNACQRCARSKILRITAYVAAARRHAFHEIGDLRVGR